MKDDSSIKFCPVPSEQQPINEYEELKESWFFHWVTLDISSYIKKLSWIAFWGGLLIVPLIFGSFPPQKYPLSFICAEILGISLWIAFILIRLFLGWSYISDRLYQETIFYEESGWYDGQTWQKPSANLNRDRLIVTYQIKPIFLRLKKTALILIGIITTDALIWSLFQS